MTEETSAGGSRIVRHDPQSLPAEPEFSGGDTTLIGAVDAHLDRCFGKTDRLVFHEIVSPLVHLDIHLVSEGTGFPFQRVVTSGMAEKPMNVPGDFDESPFAELTIALPSEWPMDKEAFEDERVYWPIRLLKDLARLPHEFSSFLWYGHTIGNGEPPSPYADGTDLCAALIVAPLAVPKDFPELGLSDGRTVRFLGVLPLYEDEMSLKLQKGTDALLDLFDAHGLTDVVDPNRLSVVSKRRGFFRR